ncbi:MAG: hypothetical protein K2X47_06780 [Bdellovibrionales bacterium]|nr:hypothetical protein [Bdellovibrionales bacterium]
MNKGKRPDIFLFGLFLASAALFIFHAIGLWASKDNPYYLFDGDVIYLLTGLKLFHQQPIPLLWSPALPQAVLTGILNLLPAAILSALKLDYQKTIYANLDQLMFFSRWVTLALTYLVPLLGSAIVHKNTQSRSASLLIFVGILSMRFFPDAWSGYQFDAETFSMVFFIIWMALIFRFINEPSDQNRGWVFVICGVLTAQKFCNIVILPFSFLFLFSVSEQKWDSSISKKVIWGLKWFLLSLGVFFIPVVSQINNRLPHWLQMAFHSGQYATGEISFFAFGKTFIFLKYLFSTDPFVLLVAAAIGLLLWMFPRGNTWTKLNVCLLITATLIYAKLSTFRYLTIPLATLWFFAAFLLASAPNRMKKIVVGLSLTTAVFMPLKEIRLSESLRLVVENTAAVEKFVKENPPKGIRIWSHVAAAEYAVPWSDAHALDFFPKEFFVRSYRYGFLQDFESLEYKPIPPIGDNYRLPFPRACWGQIIVPEAYEAEIQKKVGTTTTRYRIPNSTTIVFIQETECDLKSL